MAHAVTSAGSLARTAAQRSGHFRLAGVPWEVWCGALAITSAALGVEWDFSWHNSIGRDTFWTPAHMMIYACGILTGIVCSYLVLATTFAGSPAQRLHSVTIFGFQAPLGAFIATWGGLAMLVSAPFDNWWHAAYGLDVELLSPPHVLLFFGVVTVAFGFLLLCCAAMNRAATERTGEIRTFARLQTMFLYIGSVNIMLYMLIIQQRTDLWLLHNSIPYKFMALLVPFTCVLVSEVSRRRWAATSVVCFYMIVRILAILILPLFPATPKLGPVFTPVTHMVPAEFPILLIAPAIALDLLLQHTRKARLWLRAVLSGFVFVAALVGAEWPFADFLISKAAANRFFGTIYSSYSVHPADRIPHFALVQTGLPLFRGLLVATAFAIVVSGVGLSAGRWMRDVQR